MPLCVCGCVSECPVCTDMRLVLVAAVYSSVLWLAAGQTGNDDPQTELEKRRGWGKRDPGLYDVESKRRGWGKRSSVLEDTLSELQKRRGWGKRSLDTPLDEGDIDLLKRRGWGKRGVLEPLAMEDSDLDLEKRRGWGKRSDSLDMYKRRGWGKRAITNDDSEMDKRRGWGKRSLETELDKRRGWGKRSTVDTPECLHLQKEVQESLARALEVGTGWSDGTTMVP